VNKKGQTPLMVAARFGNDDAIKALLDLGANVLARDNAGLNAKGYAIKYQREIRKYNSDYQREYGERFRSCLRLLASAQPKGSSR
jgi:ankyrin repeat protein